MSKLTLSRLSNDVFADEIIVDLQDALDQFAAIVASLKN
jgi:hypothetical protein